MLTYKVARSSADLYRLACSAGHGLGNGFAVAY